MIKQWKRSKAKWLLDDDVREHTVWSELQKGRALTPEELSDLRDMLAVRGVLPAPHYDDEPRGHAV